MSSSRPATLAILIAFATLLGVGPATAHTELVASSPAAGEQVEEPLSTIALTFGDALLPDGEHAIGLFGPDGAEIAAADVAEQLEGELRLDIEVGLPSAGAYTVRWVIVAADGDEQRGEFEFVATSTATIAPAEPDAQDPIAESDDGGLVSGDDVAAVDGGDDATDGAVDSSGGTAPRVLVGVLLVAVVAVVLLRRRQAS